MRFACAQLIQSTLPSLAAFGVGLLATTVAAVVAAAATMAGVAASSPVSLDVDWPSFLMRSDPTWDWQSDAAGSSSAPPRQWVDALFGGNGDHGFQLWAPAVS